MSPVDLKIVLLGKEHSGKTSLVERFIYNRFRGNVPYQNTIGAAFGAKRLEVDGEKVTLGVWDTAGSERYEAMCRIYYRNAGAAIICYDLTDETTFEKAKFWVEELRKVEQACKIYLCGTKNDLIKADKNLRKVDYHTATDYADEVNIVGVFETSSKDNNGVHELFVTITENFVRSKLQNVDGGIEKFSLLPPRDSGQKSSCC